MDIIQEAGIDPDTLVRQFGRTQAQFDAMRDMNNGRYKASGFVHKGKHDANNSAGRVGEGLWAATAADTRNKLLFGRSLFGGGIGESVEYEPVLNIEGVLTHVTLGDGYKGFIKLPQAPDGKTTYNKINGESNTYATAALAFAAADSTIAKDVVVHRHDAWGFEGWLEEVTLTNPHVYPHGLPQSTAPLMDGITTVVSNRPTSYYAWFDGDDTSKGLGVNYFTATDAEKKKLLGNHRNNMYFLDDGRLVQWRVRGRSFAGAGNGDWYETDATKPHVRFALAKGFITPQGDSNVVTAMSDSTLGFYSGISSPTFQVPERVGAMKASSGAGKVSEVAVRGECYFLVCGTVNRLNQGAYHPSFNPLGSSTWWRSTTDSAPSNWYASTPPQTSLANCFGGYNRDTGEIGSISGRPDNRFYDVIYSSGQGGVCRDMRYSANGLTPTDFVEADQKVKNGSYRGFEQQVFTKINQAQFAEGGHSGGGTWFKIQGNNTPSTYVSAGDAVYLPRVGTVGYATAVESFTGGGFYIVATKDAALANDKTINPVAANIYSVGDVIYFMRETQLGASMGGTFLQTDVIGNPANILLTDAFKDGWEGSWIPELPKGASNHRFPLTRKANADRMNYVFTTNNGASWLTDVTGTGGADGAIDSVNNTFGGTLPNSSLLLLPYQAFAKQTESAVNGAVYGGRSGVGTVDATSWGLANGNGFALLAESFLGRVLTSNSGYHDIDMGVSITRANLVRGGVLSGDVNALPHHEPLMLLAPVNNSSAVKVLNYSVAINLQGFLQYAYTELKHNGSNWGDDGMMAVVDNQSTKVDLNGTAVLVGTAKLKEPLGWL